MRVLSGIQLEVLQNFQWISLFHDHLNTSVSALLNSIWVIQKIVECYSQITMFFHTSICVIICILYIENSRLRWYVCWYCCSSCSFAVFVNLGIIRYHFIWMYIHKCILDYRCLWRFTHKKKHTGRSAISCTEVWLSLIKKITPMEESTLKSTIQHECLIGIFFLYTECFYKNKNYEIVLSDFSLNNFVLAF